MYKTSTYKTFRNLNYDYKYKKIFNFKDIEILIKKFSSNDSNQINYIYPDSIILEKKGIDRVFVFILEGEITILDENKNKLESLKSHDFFELCFKNLSQYLSFYASKDLKLFIVNNNSNSKKDNFDKVNNLRFNLKPSNNIKGNFNQNHLFDFLKTSKHNWNKDIDGVKFETEEFLSISNYKNFKIIKALYKKNDKANLFLKDIIPKNNSKKHTNATYVLSGKLDIVSKYTGNIIETLSEGESFTSNSYELAENYYFVSRDNLELLLFTTDVAYAELYESINKFHNASLQCQEKDMYTHLHNQRVGSLSMMIAERIGLSKERLESLRIASLFHDIGKVFTPNEILLKPGKLTNEEYEIMKKHVLHSYDMTKDFIDKDVCEIVIQHHERLNGCGYPYGLLRDDILIEAKILAIADAYDAMTSDRPYRKALSADFAIKELLNYVDIHYDRELIKVFHDILYETKEITVRYI